MKHCPICHVYRGFGHPPSRSATLGMPSPCSHGPLLMLRSEPAVLRTKPPPPCRTHPRSISGTPTGWFTLLPKATSLRMQFRCIPTRSAAAPRGTVCSERVGSRTERPRASGRDAQPPEPPEPPPRHCKPAPLRHAPVTVSSCAHIPPSPPSPVAPLNPHHY